MATNACAELSEPAASLEAIHEAMGKLAVGRREFEEFLTDLFDRWREREEECALLEREEEMLQGQLEAARRHNLKLVETLAAQQRRNSRQQIRWHAELKHLRRLLEDLGRRLPPP